MSQTLLLTGFEPFLDVTVNPSGEIAQRLHRRILRHPGGDVEVFGVVLPVSFARAPEAHAEALDGLGQAPVAIVSLGVHRGPEFRLETRASSLFGSGQLDNDGLMGAEIRLPGPEVRETSFDLTRCEVWLREAGAEVTTISDDAGGYLCERVFRAGLDAPSSPALFLHIPPIEHVGVEEQEHVVLGFLKRLVSSL